MADMKDPNDKDPSPDAGEDGDVVDSDADHGESLDANGPEDDASLARRTQRLARRSGPRRVRVVAENASLAHVEDQRTRNLVVGVAHGATPPPPVPPVCQEASDSLFLLFLPSVDGEARTRRQAIVESHRECANEYADIRRHLALHKASPAPALPFDGFAKLRFRLKREGYLKYSWPGSAALWRRAFVASAIAACLVIVLLFMIGRTQSQAAFEPRETTFGTLTVLDRVGNPLRPPKSLVKDQQESVRDGAGYIWLPTGDRGTSVQVRVREGTKFVIEGPSRFNLDEGEATEVIVSPESTVAAAFVFLTRKAEIKTEGSMFSVESDESRMAVYVYSGSVTVRPIGGGPTRYLTSGLGMSIATGDLPSNPFPLLDLSIEAAPGRVLNVTVRNRSRRHLEVSRAIGNQDFPYHLRIDQDQAGATDFMPFHDIVPSVPLPSASASRGDGREGDGHRGFVVLSPEGQGGQSTYQFMMDLGSILAGADAADYTMMMEYRGSILVTGMGPMPMRPISRSIRYDTKSGSLE